MNEGIDELKQRKAKAASPRPHSKGLSHARERIAALIDRGTSFREFGLLAHSDVPGTEDKTLADGKICGIGSINGRQTVITADDATVLAGSGGRVGSAKAMRWHEFLKEKACQSSTLAKRTAQGSLTFEVPTDSVP